MAKYQLAEYSVEPNDYVNKPLHCERCVHYKACKEDKELMDSLAEENLTHCLRYYRVKHRTRGNTSVRKYRRLKHENAVCKVR